MWENLSEQTKQRIQAAGDAPGNFFYLAMGNSDAHRDLFTEYFGDNCHEDNDNRAWECYWWLQRREALTANRSYYSARTRSGPSRYELIELFEATYGPNGDMAINWPGEVTGWYATYGELTRAKESAYKPEWDQQDDPTGPEWDTYQRLVDQLWDWEKDNPYPFEQIQKYCEELLSGWYKAYLDEIARLSGAAMTAFELDRDFIDSVNKINLDGLVEGAEVRGLGYGYYVLIGEHPKGYVDAVMSYDKAWYGTVKMKAKGGAFSPGKVEVTGCEGEDQKWFKEAFRRVSKKAIDFL